MRRRGLIHAGAAAMIWSSSAGAQQGPIPRIRCLFTRANYGESFNTLRRGLRDLGYVEGKNILLDVRSSDGNNGRLPELATELVSLKPAVIVSNGPFAIRAVKDAAGTIPIVMSVIDDPVGLGFAQSLAHPGGNFTGLSNLAEGLVSKRLEMLLEVAETPAASRCCTIPGSQQMNRSTGRMADMQVPSSRRSACPSFVPALNLSQQRASAAIIPGDPFFLDRLGQIVALEARYVLPTVYEGPEFPMSGGLMNYGASFLGAFGDLATYTGRILKGARPEDLPVEQTTKFEMVINLKTAGAGVDTWCNGRKFGLAEEPRLRRATMAASRLRPTRTPQLLGAAATPLHPM